MLSNEQILELIRQRVHHPASTRELMQALKIPREERPAFRRHLKTLVAEGNLIQVRGRRYGLPDKMDLVVGRLETHPSGYGFVVPERRDDPTDSDIYVSAANLKEAMHGDRVLARIERVQEDGRREGRIVRIVERGSTHVVGRFETDEAGVAFVLPFDRRVLAEVHVPSGETRGARPGEMVMVEITRWPTATRGPVGRVAEVLGDLDAPGVDTTVIIRKYGIPDEHSTEAVEEARRMTRGKPGQPLEASPKDVAGRTDFRHLPIVTIDGEHARDFDDAISIERLDNGHYRLGVHIADVSHYVKEGTALDEEAYTRGTSVYFPDRAVHMFPEALATGLCSLNPHLDRLVQSCVMDVDKHGNVVAYEFHDGVINTTERMTYTAVNAILTEHDPETTTRYRRLVPMFELMRELFTILNDRRRRLGSVDFDLPEPELVLDPEGMVEAIIASERNIAHRIIEEFMLLANETVAGYLDEKETPALYRVHEEPDPLKVEKFEQFVTSLGYSLAAPPDGVRPRHFQRLITRLHGKPEERPVAFLMLRTMQKARYDPRNLGHFGLAFESYTHFTSPIRRYPDLVVHRMLREARKGGMPQARREELDEELPEAARHTSDMERRADDAERELVQWKKVRFMADKVGDEFDGYITGVAPFGLFVELVEHFVEGLVHVSTMADDYYRYLEATHTLRGENTEKTYRLGDRVRVQVLRVDMERRQIELGVVQILDAVRQEESRRQRRGGNRPGKRERQERKRAGSRGSEPRRTRVKSSRRRGRR
ncbi:MAG: ribonuclease R [Bacteroidales bacterium]